MQLSKRVANLETRLRPAARRQVHIVGQVGEQTEDEALDAYGRDRIGADDDLIVLRGPTDDELGRCAT